MSSQTNFGEYNAEERIKTIISGLEKDFDRKNIRKILSEAIRKTDIETDVEQLEEDVHSIKADGTANKYLIYEDRCCKLLIKLDGIHLESEEERKTKKALIQRIFNCSTLLKESSIENLKNLLSYLRNLDITKVHQDHFNKVDNFIAQSSDSNIKEVEECRNKLEDIKPKNDHAN